MKKPFIGGFSFCLVILLSAFVPNATAQLTFQPFYSPEKTFDVNEMKLGDFDGDSFQDAAYVSIYTKQINIIYHLASPSLRTTQAISVNSTHSGNLYHLETSDLNGDGKGDLTIIETSVQGINLMVLLSTGNSFIQQAIPLGNAPVSSIPKIIDFDKDGKLDVAIATSRNIIFYKGDGHGAFTLSSTPQLSSTPTSIGNEHTFDIADINADGAIDLVVYVADTLFTFINGGNGSSFATFKLRAPGIIPSAIKIGDLNGDNFPEITMVSIAGGIANLLKFANSNGTYASPVNLSISSISGSKNIDLADFNKDNKLDMVLSGGDYSTAFVLLKNNGDNTFTNVAPPSNNSHGIQTILFSDIDNDNKLEIVELSQFKFINIYALNGSDYQFSQKIVVGTSAAKGIMTDLNNDSKQDIITFSSGGESVSYFYGTGNKTFGNPGYLTSSSSIKAIAVEDFNKDGYKDILYSEGYASYGSSIFIVPSDNTGKLTTKIIVDDAINAKSSSVLASGDFDNDGNIDFATDHGVYINNGAGAFLNLLSYTLPFSPSSLAVGHFNNDNALDLVFNDKEKNYISLNNGVGNFSTFTAIVGSQYYISIKSALINNDKFYDLVSIKYDAGNYSIDVLFSNGDGTFTVHQTVTAPTSDQFAGYADVADLDKDGRVDIVAGVSGHDYGSIVYLQDANGSFNFSQTIPVSSVFGSVYSPDFIQIVDTNSDGKNDVVMYSDELLDPVSIVINDLVYKPTQSSSISLTNKTDVSATFSLTKGNGNARLVVVRKSDTKRSLPSGNTFYTTNTQFGSGAQIGTSNYAVILKDTTAITITGLTQSIEYTVSVYECNKNLSQTFINYLTTSYDSVNITTKKTQTLTIPSVADKIIGSNPFQLTVTSSAGLPVILTAETSNIAISSDMVTLVKAGPAKITASSAASADYASVSQEINFCVNPMVPTITVLENQDHTYLLTSSSDTNNHWLVNGQVIDTATHKTYRPIANGIYSVQVEAGTCHSISDPTAYIITAVEPSNDKSIYPNPFTEFIFVTGVSNAKIQIANVNGQAEPVTIDRENELWRIDAKSLCSGLYIVKVQTQSTINYFKVIKSQ